MRDTFVSKYKENWNNSSSVVGELGVFVKKQYRRSDIEIGIITDSVLPSVKLLLKKKIEDEKIFLMEYNNHSTSEIYLLELNDEFSNPLENIIESETEGYEYLFENRGNIIVLVLTINGNKYDVFIGDTGGDILGKGKVFNLNKQPKKLERKETLIINTNNLICIKDYTANMLIIKDTKRASNLYGLDKYFENKAREILGYTVENSNSLRLKKNEIDRILKNSGCYELDYINDNKTNFIEVMKENGIKYIQDNELDLNDNEKPRIILKNDEVINYIEGLNKVIERNPISGEEREVVK